MEEEEITVEGVRVRAQMSNFIHRHPPIDVNHKEDGVYENRTKDNTR